MMGPDTSQARHFCSDPGYIFTTLFTFALEFDAHNRMFFRILTVGAPSYLFFFLNFFFNFDKFSSDQLKEHTQVFMV